MATIKAQNILGFEKSQRKEYKKVKYVKAVSKFQKFIWKYWHGRDVYEGFIMDNLEFKTAESFANDPYYEIVALGSKNIDKIRNCVVIQKPFLRIIMGAIYYDIPFKEMSDLNKQYTEIASINNGNIDLLNYGEFKNTTA